MNRGVRLLRVWDAISPGCGRGGKCPGKGSGGAFGYGLGAGRSLMTEKPRAEARGVVTESLEQHR